MSDDPLRTDLERATTYPPSWNPNPGDMLIGRLEEVVHGVPTRYGPVDVAYLCTEPSGELVSVWLSNTVMRDQWTKAAPKVGERVGVKYVGQKTSKAGTPYRVYAVRVDRIAPVVKEPQEENNPF